MTAVEQLCEPRILAEYAWLTRRATFDHLRELMSHGVSIRAMIAVCPVPARVGLDRGGERYWLDASGRPAGVLPVCCADPEDPEAIEARDPLAAISIGSVVDLLAFHPDAPRRWALRHGNAAALGAIEPQYLDPHPVPVHRDVTDWLRSGCNGIVLLTRDPLEARRVLQQIANIEAEDQRHAAEIAAALATPLPVCSRITVRTGARTAA